MSKEIHLSFMQILYSGKSHDNRNFIHRWSDGSPVKFTAWDTEQPDNYNDAEDCVTIQIRHGRFQSLLSEDCVTIQIRHDRCQSALLSEDCVTIQW